MGRYVQGYAGVAAQCTNPNHPGSEPCSVSSLGGAPGGASGGRGDVGVPPPSSGRVPPPSRVTLGSTRIPFSSPPPSLGAANHMCGKHICSKTEINGIFQSDIYRRIMKIDLDWKPRIWSTFQWKRPTEGEIVMTGNLHERLNECPEHCENFGIREFSYNFHFCLLIQSLRFWNVKNTQPVQCY